MANVSLQMIQQQLRDFRQENKEALREIEEDIKTTNIFRGRRPTAGETDSSFRITETTGETRS